MATIGTKKSSAEFLGQIVTLTVQTKNVSITLEPAAPAGKAEPLDLRRLRRGRRRLVEALRGAA